MFTQSRDEATGESASAKVILPENNNLITKKAKRNTRQRCMCESPVRTKSELTTMFHLDSMADDA